MAPELKSITCNRFSNNSNSTDSKQDPNVNFFPDNILSLNTKYFFTLLFYDKFLKVWISWNIFSTKS